MLEALPVEIIEQIFLNCLNLNLPRASPILATALSREHLYKVLIILAFWHDPIRDDRYPSSEAIERVFAPLEYTQLPVEQRYKLQEQIFRCKWCTRERIQEQLPQMMNLTIHRHWINAGIIMEPDQKVALDLFMTRKGDAAGTFHGHRPARKVAVYPGVPQDSHDTAYKMHIRANEVVEIYRTGNLGWRSVVWPVLGLLTFPSYLLRGRSTGFTGEDVLFLEMLRMCAYYCEPLACRLFSEEQVRVDREALHEGVQKAIRTQNLDALTSLLKIDEVRYRSSPRPTSWSIPSHHFITATKHGRDNPIRNIAIFEALIRASAESIPPNAREITEWIVDMSEETARKGLKYPEVNTRILTWLSDFMLRLPAHIEGVRDDLRLQIFCYGEVSDRAPSLAPRLTHALNTDEWDSSESEPETERLRFVNEVLKPERTGLGNYMLESPYRPADYW